MKSVKLYFHYRKIGLRNAWRLSGMRNFVINISIAAMASLFLFLLAHGIHSAEIEFRNRAKIAVAGELQSNKLEIAELRKIIAKCVGPKDGGLWIDNEFHLCGISSTGIKK